MNRIDPSGLIGETLKDALSAFWNLDFGRDHFNEAGQYGLDFLTKGDVVKGAAAVTAMGNAVAEIALDSVLALEGAAAVGVAAAGFEARKISAATTSNGVQTPHGIAQQAKTPDAMKALADVKSDASLFRQGKFEVQNTSDGQFWSLQNPATTENFADKLGMPGGAITPDWIMKGTLKPGTPVVTRPAPGIGTNSGGNMEAVVPQNGVRLDWFSAGKD